MICFRNKRKLFDAVEQAIYDLRKTDIDEINGPEYKQLEYEDFMRITEELMIYAEINEV